MADSGVKPWCRLIGQWQPTAEDENLGRSRNEQISVHGALNNRSRDPVARNDLQGILLAD